MFVKEIVRGEKTYIVLAESYRENGKVKQRVVSSLGNIKKFAPGQLHALADKLKKLDRSGKPAASKSMMRDISTLEEQAKINWGAPKVVRSLWEAFGMDAMIARLLAKSKIKFDVNEAVLSIVINRFVAPASKLQVFEQQKNYIGVKSLDLQAFYRCLDFLSDHKEELEKEIFLKNRHLFNMKVDVVFYDVTTLYFESTASNALKDFGYSKDCKFNEVQVVVGLLIDAEGRPVGFDVYPGNTFEGKTLEGALHKLKSRFQVDKVIIVADRGINSKINLKAVRDAGFDYIVGSRLRKMPAAVRAQALDISTYTHMAMAQDKGGGEDDQDELKIKVIDYVNTVTVKASEDSQGKKTPKSTDNFDEKIVLTWSKRRAEKDKKDRERLVNKAIAMVSQPSLMKEARGAKKYVKHDAAKNVKLNEEKILEDAKWDGFYGIQTSNKEMSADKITEAYHTLWRIEESFRVLKFSLKMRPIFHWNERRIKGHLVCCFLAFLLERTLEIELRKKNIDYSIDKIKKAITSLTLTPLAIEGETFYSRAPVEGLAKHILQVLHIKTPRNICRIDDLNL